MTTIVDRLHSEFRALAAHLEAGAEASLRSTAEESFRKALLMAAASYFEMRVTSAILTFTRSAVDRERLVPEFVYHKALSRQYHALFDWNAPNANKFYALFGPEFKSHMTRKVEADGSLKDAVGSFIELGRERNRLVHEDYGSYSLEKTADEIFATYSRALVFVDRILHELGECSTALESASTQSTEE